MSDRVQNGFLISLPTQTYAQLAPHLSFTALRSGQCLYRPDDPVETVYFPTDSLLAILGWTEEGRSVQTSMVGNALAVGVLEALGSGVAGMGVEVDVGGGAAKMSAALYRKIAMSNPDLHSHSIKLIEVLMAESRQAVVCHAIHHVQAQMARYLLEAWERSGQPTHLPYTQEWFSQRLGVQRTTVTLHAGEFRKAGLVRYLRGSLQILDPVGLEARACSCFRALKAERDRLGLPVKSSRFSPAIGPQIF